MNTTTCFRKEIRNQYFSIGKKCLNEYHNICLRGEIIKKNISSFWLEKKKRINKYTTYAFLEK